MFHKVSAFQVARAWIQFEREEGSLDAFEHCLKAVRAKRAKMEALREKEDRAKEGDEYLQRAKIEKKKVGLML